MAETSSLPSEPELGATLGVSRTTIRAILTRMEELQLIAWDKRGKDGFAAAEAGRLLSRPKKPIHCRDIIERSFMRRILAGGAEPGMQINELELARDIGTGTTSVREFLIRFSRFGLIEKRPNSHWMLKGFTREFALELTEVREMFELRSAASFAALPRAPGLGRSRPHRGRASRMLADIDNRFNEFSELDERFHLLVHTLVEQPLHRRFLRHHRHRLPLSLPVEQGERARTQRPRARRTSRLYRGA